MEVTQRHEFLKEVKKLAPLIGRDKVVDMEVLYLAGDEKTRSLLMDLVDAVKAAMLSIMPEKDMVVFEPPPKEVACNGKLHFGDVVYGGVKLYPFKLDPEVFLHHVGIFGSTGYGKTNLVQHLLVELAKLDIPVVVFDFSKRNYRDLMRLDELRDKLRVYTVGRNVVPFYFNPVKPPENVPFSQWSKEFAEIFDHAYWMMGGGRYIVLRALDELESMAEGREIKLKDIRAWIYANEAEFASARERNWAATAKRALDSLCFREIGEAFNPKTSYNPAELFFQPNITVLELDALSSNDRTFFIEIILQWLRDWLLVNGKKEKLNGIMVVEEAHHILNREKTKKLGTETVTDVIFREIRELGVGIVYTDQHPSLVSYTALGNTSTQVYMNLGLETKQASDVDDAASMLNLASEEEKDFLRRLRIGEGMVFCRKIEFTKPFLVRFPKVSVEKGSVSDEEVRESMKEFVEVGVEKDEESEEKDNDLVGKEKGASRDGVLDERVEKLKNELNARQLAMLRKLINCDAAKASQLYKDMGISGTTFRKLMDDMLNLGVVDFEGMRVSGQNAHIYFVKDAWRDAVISMFGDVSDEGCDTRPLDDMVEMMKRRGFIAEHVSNHLVMFSKGNRRIFILFDTGKDALEEMLKMGKEVNVVVVKDDRCLNAFLQSLAQLKKKEKVSGILFRVNTVEGVKKASKFVSVEL